MRNLKVIKMAVVDRLMDELEDDCMFINDINELGEENGVGVDALRDGAINLISYSGAIIRLDSSVKDYTIGPTLKLFERQLDVNKEHWFNQALKIFKPEVLIEDARYVLSLEHAEMVKHGGPPPVYPEHVTDKIVEFIEAWDNCELFVYSASLMFEEHEQLREVISDLSIRMSHVNTGIMDVLMCGGLRPAAHFARCMLAVINPDHTVTSNKFVKILDTHRPQTAARV